MQSADIGQSQMTFDRKFQACTCQFAAHYFFASRETLRTFLANVATALDEGGHFFGTIPDGKQILNVLRGQDLYDSNLLRVRRTWPGPFNSFGSFGAGYTFAIASTVTNVNKDSDDLEDGCEEFLVFFNAFTEMAAEVGLFPPRGLDWQREFGQLFDRRPPASSQGKPYEAFRLFNPRYDPSNPDSAELEKISRVYAGFVFRKDTSRTKPAPPQPRQGGGASAGTVQGVPPGPEAHRQQQSRQPNQEVGQKRRAEEGVGSDTDVKRRAANSGVRPITAVGAENPSNNSIVLGAVGGSSTSTMPHNRSEQTMFIALEPLGDQHRGKIKTIVNEPTVAKWMGTGRGWTDDYLNRLIMFCKKDADKPSNEVGHFYWAVMAPVGNGAVDVVGLVAVHHVRYIRPREGEKQKFFLTIFIDGKVQGRGIGRKATQECLAEFKKKRPDVDEVHADVHDGNEASAALMKKAGFVIAPGSGKAWVGNTEVNRFIYEYSS